MKIKEFLKFYLGYNTFQVVNETGDRWTDDILSKEEVLKSFGNAELKRTDIDGEEYMCSLVLFIADKDFKEWRLSYQEKSSWLFTMPFAISRFVL